MIKQVVQGLNSRQEANPFNENGFLPLITAPMYSVVNETNYQTFLDNKIQVCLPRNITFSNMRKFNGFVSYSLEDFKKYFIDLTGQDYLPKVCIDTANGNMPALHSVIRKAKEIHGDKLIIMAGNVGSVEAFVELAKTGVDYIRVGIGGGGGCNTTSNTGVGQENLENLIKNCFSVKRFTDKCLKEQLPKQGNTHYIYRQLGTKITGTIQEFQFISKVKIVADGISSYINYCEREYGFNDNGYAAINKLLFAGADLVMVGKLFAQCLESAGDKTSKIRYNGGENWIASGKAVFEIWNNENDELMVKYSGMSTQEEQKNYKTPVMTSQMIMMDFKEGTSESIGEPYRYWGNKIKPSEGSVNWIPVRWTLNEWLHGSKEQDTYPYLMGWVNSIKSAMSYVGRTKLD